MIARRVKSFMSLFSDKSLTRKATLNALASGTDYVAKLLVGLVINPLMVTGFGDYFFGVWQVMNRIFSYMSTVSGTSSPLEWTLANDQASNDYDQKRAYVGSSLVIWLMFLPLVGILGGIITWFAPSWLDAPAQHVWTVRVVAALFILSELSGTLSFLPYVILRGQNLGYRRLGLSVILILFNGGISWLALYLETGIIGVSVAGIIQYIVIAIFYSVLCKKYVPWFGARRPSRGLVKRFLGLSGWFFVGDIVQNVTYASDAVILGLLSSVESVTPYTLTKYIPETVSGLVAILVASIIPGLGGIIGTKDFKKASQVRGEIFSLTWFIVTVIGTSVLLWNNIFLDLWVGPSRYPGSIANLWIVIVVAQSILIRTDGSIIDVTLRVQRKVLLGIISVLVSIVIASVLVGIYDLGIVGVSIGMFLGRLILSYYYPVIVSRFLGDSMKDQLKQVIRPALTTIILYGAAFWGDNLLQSYAVRSGVMGWVILLLGAGITAVTVMVPTFYVGLTAEQREKMLSRFKGLLSR